jgi:hypothetical protein
VLQPLLADADRDASLRLGVLRLLDSLMEQQGTAGAFGGQNAGLVLKALLMPPLVWRAGKVRAFLAWLRVCKTEAAIKLFSTPASSNLPARPTPDCCC